MHELETVKPLFIADVHLGKLARNLRLLGFDTLYTNACTQAELIAVALEQNRILLSRYAGYAKYPAISSFIIQSEEPAEQLKQLVPHFHLANKLHPFSKCLVCNGTLEPVAKENILAQLQSNTSKYFNEFWQCDNCKRIYWKGPHYNRMLTLVEKVKQWVSL